MSSDQIKLVCLLEELETSRNLIRAGFGNLQEIDIANDFYHLPHQLMASGLERLMKCYIALVVHGDSGSFPDMAFMKDLGHDLTGLLGEICSKYYGGTSRQLVQEELDFLKSDRILQDCVRILSHFGKFGRYYNLDVVAGSPHSLVDPKKEWEKLERTVEDPTPFLTDMESLHRDYYPRVHGRLISTLERLVRAIALQFTLGDHQDLSGKLRQLSSVFTHFRNLRSNQLGLTDYRQSVRVLQQRSEVWVKRSADDVINGSWPTRIVEQKHFEGDWPFRSDRVILELQQRLFAIVYIEEYAFALNGSAASHLKLPTPHAAGMAVLGKSIGPFIEMARNLGGTQQ